VDAITSNAGWDTITNKKFLSEICGLFRKEGIRTSIFVDPNPEMVRHAVECGCDRVELYTESYAAQYVQNKEHAIAKFITAAQTAQEENLGLNAGHDLNLINLRYFQENIPNLLEVSIGHALISDALYYGLEKTIQLYRKELL
jgi:pyridoxine 5-phosphate synthase